LSRSSGHAGPLGRRILAAPVELLAEGAEDLELDAVLRSAGGALHCDEIIQTRNLDADAEDVGGDRMPGEDLEIKPGIRACEQIQVAKSGAEHEDVAGSQGPHVERRDDSRWHVPTNRRQVRENGGQTLEIGPIERETDVDVECQRRRSMDLRGKTADEDELDIGVSERGEDLACL
jgi:hypothetical protein